MNNKITEGINEILSNNGFKQVTKREAEDIIYSNNKKAGENILRISFLLSSDVSKKENVIFFGFNYGVNFLAIEKILVPILVQNNLAGKSYNSENVYESFHLEKKTKNKLAKSGKKIQNEKDIIDVSNLFSKFYKEDALPYFEKWHSINVLYEHIKKLPDTREILSDCLGQFWQLKKSIIYRLCNDSSYLEYITSYYKKRKEIFKNHPNEIVAKQYYNAAKELKEILENTKPIYNLEV